MMREELGEACEKGNLELVQQLLEARAPLTFDEKGRHPLHLAAAKGHSSVVRWIVKLSISVDLPQKDRDGMSPLLLAARFGHLKLFNWLLWQGADSNYVTGERKEWNILSAAAANPNPRLLRRIMLDDDLPGINFIPQANAHTQAAIIAQSRYFISLSEDVEMIQTSILWMGSIMSDLRERLKEGKMDTIAEQIGLPTSYLKLMESACRRSPELYMECAQDFMKHIDGCADTKERSNLTKNELMRVLKLPFLRKSTEYSSGVLLVLGWKFLQLSCFRLKDKLSPVTQMQEVGGALIDYFQENKVVRYQAFVILTEVLYFFPPVTPTKIKPLIELIILHQRPLYSCLYESSVRRKVKSLASIKRDLNKEVKNAVCAKRPLRRYLLDPVNEKARVELFTATAQALFPASRREELKDETFRQAIVTFNIAAEWHRNQVAQQAWRVIDILDSAPMPPQAKHGTLPACG